eukprot:gene12481-13656_t
MYFGQMIGCDTCDEWYHFQCVGLSVAQAEKAEKYTCIRCALRNSVQITASYAAKIANKWMDCMRDHFPLVDQEAGEGVARISNKIGTWKTKTKKAFTNPKKLDEGKVNSLLLDGNNLLVTSRMKAILKVNHDKFQPKTASLSASVSAIATTSNVGGEGGVSSGSGKRNKTAASATQLLNSSSVATSASLSLSLSAIEAFPNSSDDETYSSPLL